MRVHLRTTRPGAVVFSTITVDTPEDLAAELGFIAAKGRAATVDVQADGTDVWHRALGS